MNLFGFHHWMRDNIYKGGSFSLPDTVVHFNFEVRIQGIVERTSYSPVLAHTVVLR